MFVFGTEDQHIHLRALAFDYIKQNMTDFHNYFIPPSAEDQSNFMSHELDWLSRDGVYTGHESIVALGRHFGINIQITLGGTAPAISTIAIDPVNEDQASVHTIYSGVGGGHYDVALQQNLVENDSAPWMEVEMQQKINLFLLRTA